MTLFETKITKLRAKMRQKAPLLLMMIMMSINNKTCRSNYYFGFRKRLLENWNVTAQVGPHGAVATTCFAVQNDALFVILIHQSLLLLLLARGIQPRQPKIPSVAPTKLLS